MINMQEKFVVWGIGVMGMVALYFLGKENIIAFIDSNKQQQGKIYYDIPVISFEEYCKSYSDYYIIVTPLEYDDICDKLKNTFNNKYLLLNNIIY